MDGDLHYFSVEDGRLSKYDVPYQMAGAVAAGLGVLGAVAGGVVGTFLEPGGGTIGGVLIGGGALSLYGLKRVDKAWSNGPSNNRFA